MSDSQIFKTWMNRIESGIFTKSQCQQWASAVVPLSNGDRPRGKATRLTPSEARQLRSAIVRRGGGKLTVEHTNQGMRWLGNGGAERVGLPSDWLARFRGFYFDGRSVNIQPNWGVYVPLWLVDLDNEVWAYYAASWQSGSSDAGAFLVSEKVTRVA